MTARAPTSPSRAAALAAWLALAGAAQAQPRPPDPAREAFETGHAALVAGRHADAVTALEQSYYLRPLPVVLYNLALAYRGAGRNADAVDAFERYLAAPEAGARPALLATIRREVASLRARLATLAVTTAPPDATLRVDGRPVTGDRAALALDPGAHHLEAMADGHRVALREVTLSPGEHAILELRLERLAPPSAPVASEPARRRASVVVPTTRARGLSPLVWIGGGVAVVAAGTAVALWATGRGMVGDFTADCAGQGAPSWCEGQRAWLTDTLDTRATAISVLWGVAAAGAVTAGVGVALSLTGRERPPSRPVAVWVGPRTAGLEVTW